MQTVWQWLDEEERSIKWLAQHTARTYSSVWRYRDGSRSTPDDWIAAVEKLAARKFQWVNGKGKNMPRLHDRFTDAQRRALEWLPSDGSWRINPGRLSAALGSLWLQHKGLVATEWGEFGPRGGRTLRWRLTSVGVAAKHSGYLHPV